MHVGAYADYIITDRSHNFPVNITTLSSLSIYRGTSTRYYYYFFQPLRASKMLHYSQIVFRRFIFTHRAIHPSP